MRGLCDQGFKAKDVRELFRLIDWMMKLPPDLTEAFWVELNRIQVERKMPFVTSIERLGQCKGLRKGIEVVLRMRFGDEGLKLMPEIREIHEEQKLDAIITALETAASPEEIRQLWSKGTS